MADFLATPLPITVGAPAASRVTVFWAFLPPFLPPSIRHTSAQSTKPCHLVLPSRAASACPRNQAAAACPRNPEIASAKPIPSRTPKMVADALTKSLPSTVFIRHHSVCTLNMFIVPFYFFFDYSPPLYDFLIAQCVLYCPHCAWGRATHHSYHSVMRKFVSGPPIRSTAPYTREFVTESPVLGRVREQFVDLEQSSLRNDHCLEAVSFLSSDSSV